MLHAVLRSCQVLLTVQQSLEVGDFYLHFTLFVFNNNEIVQSKKTSTVLLTDFNSVTSVAGMD